MLVRVICSVVRVQKLLFFSKNSLLVIKLSLYLLCIFRVEWYQI